MRRTLLAASLLATLLAPWAAFAQAPPAVPALPDTERRTAYSLNASTCACNLNFAVFGDGTDIDSWIEVWVNGVRKLSTDPTSGWSLSSNTGSLSTIPRPITDAVLTFTNPQTATIQIVGARRPRQLTQFTENRGVAARDLNQRLTDITAIERELWDKTSDLSGRGLFFAPGNTTGPMPQPSACANNYLAFDATGLNPLCNPIIGTGSFVGVGAGLANNSGTISIPSSTAGQGLSYNAGVFSTVSGIDANIANVQTSNYTVQTTDCGITILAGTGSTGFFTITVPAVSGFPSTCSVWIKNGNTATGSGRAVMMAAPIGGITSGGIGLLYPGQTINLKIVNGAWQGFSIPARWQLRGSGVGNNTYTWFVDGTNGSDSTTDGLASGTGAFATCQHAIDVINKSVDANQQNIVVSVADASQCGQVNAKEVVGIYNFWPNSPLLLQGNLASPVAWNCGGTSNICFHALSVKGWRVQGFNFSNYLSVFESEVDASIYIGQNTFSGSGSTIVPITCIYKGFCELVGNITDNATAEDKFVNVEFGAEFVATGNTITLTNAVTYNTAFALAIGKGNIVTGGALTFAGTGAAGSTGKAYESLFLSYINNGNCTHYGSQGNSAYYPGNAEGVAQIGGSTDTSGGACQ